MATKCPKCGYERSLSDASPDYECPSCGVIYAKYSPPLSSTDLLREQRRLATKLATLPVLTIQTVPGHEIADALDVVSAQCAYGMNIFKDIMAGLVDVTGGRSGMVQNTLRDARLAVLAELRREAFHLGADAVVGVDLDFSEFSGGGKSMLFVVATGTAVRLKPTA